MRWEEEEKGERGCFLRERGGGENKCMAVTLAPSASEVAGYVAVPSRDEP